MGLWKRSSWHTACTSTTSAQVIRSTVITIALHISPMQLHMRTRWVGSVTRAYPRTAEGLRLHSLAQQLQVHCLQAHNQVDSLPRLAPT